MLTLSQRLLGLTPRELRRAGPLFGYLFLTMAGSVASKAARDALFLDRFDATALPYVDIAIAVLVGFVAGIYIRAGSRTNLRNVQVVSLLGFAGSAVVFWWYADAAAAGRSGALFIAIYIWVGVLSVLAPTQVWTLANYMLTTREAKRAFGLIGGGAILGWIVGGLATRELAARFGTESMLLWVAGTLLLSAGIVWAVWDRRSARVEGDSPSADEEGGFWSSFSLVRGSPYLTAIASVIWLAAFVTTIVGWQFKAIAKANIPGTDDLAMFFGSFNIVAGLLVAGPAGAVHEPHPPLGRHRRHALHRAGGADRELRRAAAGRDAARRRCALKASDQVLRYSIDKATVELLYLPVRADLIFRVKSFIDTVVYRVGDALGGLAVLLFASVLGLSPVRAVVDCHRRARRLAVGGDDGAPAVCREPAREHPSASRGHGARGRAGAGASAPPS